MMRRQSIPFKSILVFLVLIVLISGGTFFAASRFYSPVQTEEQISDQSEPEESEPAKTKTAKAESKSQKESETVKKEEPGLLSRFFGSEEEESDK